MRLTEPARRQIDIERSTMRTRVSQIESRDLANQKNVRNSLKMSKLAEKRAIASANQTAKEKEQAQRASNKKLNKQVSASSQIATAPTSRTI